jgi:prefoldin alpha subunit
MDKVSREQMFEAEMIHQQLGNLQDYLAKIDKQIAEVLSLKDALDQFCTVKKGEELLVPLAAGVFMKAVATEDHTLHVNVGKGVVVPKSIEGVQAMLDEQLTEMRAYEQQLQQQFEELLGKLKRIEEKVQ